MPTDACIYQCAMPLYQDVLTGREKGVLKHQVPEMTSQHKFQESHFRSCSNQLAN